MAMGGIARLAFAYAEDKGVDVEPVLRSSRLSHRQISHPQIRLEVRNQIKFLEGVAETVGDDFFGFHLSRDYDLRELGFLYYVVASADRLGDALVRCARYSSVVNEGVKLTLLKTERHIGIAVEYDGVARRLERHQIEFFIGTLIRICRQITNRNLTAEHVNLSHWRRTAPEMRRFFGCDIRFGADVDEVMFSSSIQDFIVASRDPYLNRLLTQYYEEALAH
jgi:Arabinose-binding domain of AraC transcription regulator, N-term